VSCASRAVVLRAVVLRAVEMWRFHRLRAHARPDSFAESFSFAD